MSCVDHRGLGSPFSVRNRRKPKKYKEESKLQPTGFFIVNENDSGRKEKVNDYQIKRTNSFTSIRYEILFRIPLRDPLEFLTKGGRTCGCLDR